MPRGKLSVEDVDAIRRAWAMGASHKALAARYQVSETTISNVCRRASYRIPPESRLGREPYARKELR